MDKNNKLCEFLKDRRVAKGADFTHTSFLGGKYYIFADEYDEYLELYKKYNGNQFAIVEFPSSNRYVRFDIDLKFKNDFRYKKYTPDDILELVDIIRNYLLFYSTEINKMPIYILLRPREIEEGAILKNGIHIQIPNFITQYDIISNSVRNDLIFDEKISKLLNNMKVLNRIDDVFDKSIYKQNGWQQYGSNKSNDISNAYSVSYISNDIGHLEKYKPNNEDLVKLFSLRNKQIDTFTKLTTEGEEKFMENFEKLQEEERQEIKNKQLAKEKFELNKKKYKKDFDAVKDSKFIESLCDCLSFKRIDDFNTWIRLCWCLKNIDKKLFYIFDLISKKSDKYDDLTTQKKWDEAIDGTLSLGSLIYWAKQDDPVKAKYICDKFNKNDLTNYLPEFNDDSLGKDFSKRYNNFVYIPRTKKEGFIYFYNGICWVNDTEHLELKKYISNTYYIELTKILNKKYEEWVATRESIDNDIERNFEKKYCYLETLRFESGLTGLVKKVKAYIVNRDIAFDKKGNLFAFNNKVFDLDTQQFIEPKAEDYISITTGYDYEEDDDMKNKQEIITKILKEIMPNEKERECLLRISATGLYGRRFDKFTIHSGRGGNGKGLFNKLTEEVCGNYGCKANNVILTEKKKDSGGPNPAKAKLNNKRLIIFTEPDKDEKFNCSTIKEFTGEKYLDGARQLQDEKDAADIVATILCEANYKLKLTESGEAMARRIMDFNFGSEFVEDINDVDEENNIYLQNKKYDTDEWRNDMKIAFFHYLLPYLKDVLDAGYKIDIPPSIRNRNEIYLADSNVIFSWFLSLQDKENQNNYLIIDCRDKKYNDNEVIDFIKMKDLYSCFTNSKVYYNMARKERARYDKKSFIEEIKNIKSLRKYYKEKYKYKIDKKDTTTTNILLNFELNYAVDDVDEDEA